MKIIFIAFLMASTPIGIIITIGLIFLFFLISKKSFNKVIKKIAFSVAIILLLFLLYNFINPLFFYNHFVNSIAQSSKNPSVCRFIIGSSTNIWHPSFYLTIFDSGGGINKNSCITDIAANLGDFSICNDNFPIQQGITIGPLSECYIKVSVANQGNYNGRNKTVESCLDIKYSYEKKECVVGFATKKRDPSICDILSNETPQQICLSENKLNCDVKNNQDSEQKLCKELIAWQDTRTDLEIISPNGGEVLKVGEIYNIT